MPARAAALSQTAAVAIAETFYNWQSSGEQVDVPAGCSPNLRALQDDMTARWPWLTDLGCRGARPVRGSTTVPSTHTYGAALDLGYPDHEDPVIGSHVAGFLVAWSLEWGVQAVHDYRRCRIWRAGRTPDINDACSAWWRAQKRNAATGMGQPWANHLHIETTPAMWGEAATGAERGVT